MSGDGLAVADRATGVQVARQPHVHYLSGVPVLTTEGAEGHASHRRRELRVVGAQTGRFLLHLGEMALAMMVGMMVLGVLGRLVLGPLGYTLDPKSDLYEVVMTVFMVVPMAGWMRFRGMAWRPIAEMSAAMVVVPILLIGAGGLGILGRSTVSQLGHALMLPSMLVPMLLRLGYYTSSHATHRAHAA